MLENPPRQRQRWGRQRQSPSHPRLCVDLPCPLIGGPRKMGVQGGDSMENEAEGPKFDLWLPPVPLWLLSGHPERSSPPHAAKYPRPGAQAPPHRALLRWIPKGSGISLPRLLGRSQRSRVVEATTHPAPPRNLCPTMPKARPQTEEPPCWKTQLCSGSGGGSKVNPRTTRAFARTTRGA